jgi:hypothetical protein
MGNKTQSKIGRKNVMENNENLVTEQVAENVEVTTEENIQEIPEKTFTQSELNEIVKGAKARAKAQARKEYERKYGKLENVLRAGTGKESVEEITDTFAKFYEGKGITVTEKNNYSDRDNEILARAEAEDIIRLGYEDVVDCFISLFILVKVISDWT